MMVKPEIVIQFLLESAKARVPPLIVTPGLAVKIIGLPAVPELAGLTEVPEYVPALTSTVSPAWAFFAAAAIVQNGCEAVPRPVSVQEGFVLSTV